VTEPAPPDAAPAERKPLDDIVPRDASPEKTPPKDESVTEVLVDMPPVERQVRRDEPPTERSVPPEPRPVCTEGQTRACYTLSQGCTRKNGQYSCISPCKAGTQTCTNGAWSSTCVGQVGPGYDQCDGKDRDCDGKPDPCKSLADKNKPTDYAINEKGNIVALALSKTFVLDAYCHTSATSGAPVKIKVAEPAGTSSFVISPRVFAVPGKDYFLVGWSLSTINPLSATLTIRALSPQCKWLSAPKWTIKESRQFDMGFAANGSIALAHQNTITATKLTIFDANGKQTKEWTISTVQDNDGCFYLSRMSLNSKGQGVITCLSKRTNLPLQLKRFDVKGTIDSKFTVIPQSGYSTTFVAELYQFTAGINEANDIVVQWQNTKTKKSEAYFQKAGGASAVSTISTRVGRGAQGSTLPLMTPVVGVVGNDFILQDFPDKPLSSHTWYRYDSSGKRVRAISNAALPSSLRVTAKGAYFVKDSPYLFFFAPLPF
jgi:hypothetical protein